MESIKPSSSQSKEFSTQRKVSIVYDKDLIKATFQVPNIKFRSALVFHLMDAYGLLSKMTVIPSRLATTDEILSFHSNEYWEYLVRGDEGETRFVNEEKSIPGCKISTLADQPDDEYGLGYDCPIFPGMEVFCKRIAGGTISAVESLLSNNADIAINFCGGWHHAQRAEASGFCYVNDIVIGIQFLLQKFKKVLYIDLDAHHGDGVENAFSYSRNVFTLSFHTFETGYFPGTGSLKEFGNGRGSGYALNVPLKSGVTDLIYHQIFSKVFKEVIRKFPPSAIVVQCGADCLAGDPIGNMNLTEKGIGSCLQDVINLKFPILVLGGGGYNLPNTAKCWTYLTALICEVELNQDIPEHEFFNLYGPDFDLSVNPTLRKNENTQDYLSNLLTAVLANLKKLEDA